MKAKLTIAATFAVLTTVGLLNTESRAAVIVENVVEELGAMQVFTDRTAASAPTYRLLFPR
jgi:hypothetical protein